MQRDIPQPLLSENLKTRKEFFYWNVKFPHQRCSFPLGPSYFLLFLEMNCLV